MMWLWPTTILIIIFGFLYSKSSSNKDTLSAKINLFLSERCRFMRHALIHSTFYQKFVSFIEGVLCSAMLCGMKLYAQKHVLAIHIRY